MIKIHPSATADTRTCDFANTSKETLLQSSLTHINDVAKAIAFFGEKLTMAAATHDYDKLTEIDWFHRDFVTGFKQTGWWDNHRKIHRHHLAQEDGVPSDVNLLDVLEYISDCVMAGLARSGPEGFYPPVITPELLQRAFDNTVELLNSNVRVIPSPSADSTGNWAQYKRKGLSEMRPYVEGEDVTDVSISQPDRDNGSPKPGDMIARNPKNHADQWLVAEQYFNDNLEPA